MHSFKDNAACAAKTAPTMMPPPVPPGRTLDVRQVPFWHRLETILAALRGLAPGQGLELVADIDPRPLQAYLEATHAGEFEWSVVEDGPTVWRIALRPAAGMPRT